MLLDAWRQTTDLMMTSEAFTPLKVLKLFDIKIKGKHHYPCVIKMREGCEPIGEIGGGMRKDRLDYYKLHDCYKDPICQKNCLDVCVDYNNKFEECNN